MLGKDESILPNVVLVLVTSFVIAPFIVLVVTTTIVLTLAIVVVVLISRTASLIRITGDSAKKNLMHRSFSIGLKLQSLLIENQVRLQIIKGVTTGQDRITSNKAMIIRR